jgi:DNA-binding MarR family transcriptional regulator
LPPLNKRSAPTVPDEASFTSGAGADGNSLPSRFYAALSALAEQQSERELHRRQAMGMIQSVSEQLQRHAAADAAACDIHSTDVVVLILLYRANAEHVAKASVLQRSLGFTPGGVTRRLDAMTAKGLVVRVPDSTDGRAWLVRLTPAGIALARKLLVSSEERNVRLHQELSPADWQTLAGLLVRLNTALGG